MRAQKLGNATRGCYKQGMIEPSPAAESEDVSAFDAAGYIFELSREMAAMADKHRLSKLAAALELACALAVEALAAHAQGAQSGSGKAAPEDAA